MDTQVRSIPSHPTLIVGFGAFGLDVLRRVLLMSASRGALAFEEPHAGDDPSERRLRDLALFHVSSEREVRTEDALISGAGSFEMMNDLYRQIGVLEGTVDAFFAAMRDASDRLLSVTERSTRKDRLRLGLDIIVVARPNHLELAHIVELLRPVMDDFTARPNLARSSQGADRVNFIQILDFDHFWDRTQAARDLRRFLRGAIDQWEDRRKEGKGTFRRIYLVDRHAESGDRDHAFRVDEVALFLEFLLLEGRRDTEQQLFQPRSDSSPPLAAFGIRVFERSAGLLVRLAAARFGVSWLGYLARPDVGGPVRLAEKLSDCAPPALRKRFGGPDLTSLTTAQIGAIETTLAAIPLSADDFRSRAEGALREGTENLSKALAEYVEERAREWASGPMRDLRKRLFEAVDEALHGADPASISAVANAVAALAREVDPGAEPPSAVAALDVQPAIDELSRAADAHERFAADQVRTAELPRFWILLSAIFAAAIVPPLVQMIADLPVPDPTETFLTQAFDAIKFLGIPIISISTIFAVLLAATLGLLQRSAARVARRALDFYVDPERGRITDTIRRLLDRGAPLRAGLEAVGVALAQKAEVTARSEIHRELLWVYERLKERARELSWARSQLGELLKIHGVDPSSAGFSAAGRSSLGPVRSTSRLDANIEEILAATPLTEQRFQDAQRSVKPFEGWAARHNDSLLLFPLRLLERLSNNYRDPFEAELAHRGPAREHEALAVDLAEFIDAQRDFSPGFLWSARPEERTHPATALCFLPSVWSGLPRVEPALDRHALEPRQAFSDGRAYLLKVNLEIVVEQIGEGQ